MTNINFYSPQTGRRIKEDNSIVNTADMIEAIYNALVVNKNAGMQLSGSNLAEQLTQADAVGGVLTFSEPINHIEIYNTDETNTGVFVVNGISITVPPKVPYKSAIAGTPSAQVTVTGATTYIVSRYV